MGEKVPQSKEGPIWPLSVYGQGFLGYSQSYVCSETTLLKSILNKIYIFPKKKKACVFLHHFCES